MYKNNLLAEKSMDFAVRIVNLCDFLVIEKQERIISKQLLRSGTSIGANVREAIYAQSRRDFISKLGISLKETAETEYWLELLLRTKRLTQTQYNSMQCDCGELAKILIVSIKSSKEESRL